MKIRQAKKIMSHYATLNYKNRYWLFRWNAYILKDAFITSRQNGDHRIRKAIVVYEKRERKFLRNG